VAVIIKSQDLNELTLKQFGGPYDDELWTEEPTPPHVLCPDCGEPMKVEKDFFNKEWEYSCKTPGCFLSGKTWSESEIDFFYKLKKREIERIAYAKQQNPVMKGKRNVY
jgi:hypothetical protein